MFTNRTGARFVQQENIPERSARASNLSYMFWWSMIYIYIYNPLFFLQRSDLLGPGCRFCFLFVLKVLSEWLSSIELRQVLQNILSTFRNSTCVAPMPKPSDLRWGGLDSTLGGSWVASMGWRGKPKGRPDFWCWIFLGIWSQVVSIL